MKITIIGPRNTGKTLVSKHLSENYGLSYFEADFLLDKSLQDYQHNQREEKIKEAYESAKDIIDEVLKTNELVFDVGGGILTHEFHEFNKEHVEKIKKHSILVGILPHENREESLKIIAQRELEEERPCGTNIDEIMDMYDVKYSELRPKLEKHCDLILYFNENSVEDLAKEIIKFTYQNQK